MDAKRLLDQLLGGGSGGFPGQGSAGGFGTGNYATGNYGTGSGGAGGFGTRTPGTANTGTGSFGSGTGLGQGSGGGDILGQIQKGIADNPMAAKVIAGGLAAVLLKSKSRRGRMGGMGGMGSAAKLGGLGLIAALAYKAYQANQAKQAGQSTPAATGASTDAIAPAPQGSVFLPTGAEAEDRARLLVTAMIAAAKADGTIDAAEQNQIFERMGTLDLDAEDKAYLMDQLRAPLDIDGLARAARTPEVAAEVYAASLVAIDPDHPAEKAYLQMLAARLNLDPSLVTELHAAADAERAAA